MLHKKYLPFLLLFPLVFLGFTTNERVEEVAEGADAKQWVDSVFATLSPQERIGQLFMVAAYSNRDETHYQEIDQLITEYGVGGLIFFQGGPMREAKLTNRYQAKSKVPLMIGMDAEWGLGMRLDSTMDFPKQMTLGAIQDDKYIYRMGEAVADHCKRLGIHVNFAPVVDVNVNPANPVINIRSFGEDKVKVAQKGSAYTLGMQDHHVMACAKHFPGHGDTDTDSHLDLPVITHDRDRLSDVELYPFRELFKDSIGVKSVMVAHIHIPAYDDTKNRPTTLSPAVVTDLLREEMGYTGLAFTDAMNMQGVAKHNKPGEGEVQALLAGNDVLLFPTDVPKAIRGIEKALKKGKITQKTIDERVRKLLYAKYWCGLSKTQYIETENLVEDLNAPEAQALQLKLYEKAMTVAKNKGDFLPVRVLDTNTFASVSIGAFKGNHFQQTLSHYTSFDHFSVKSTEQSVTAYDEVFEQVKGKKVVVIGLHDLSKYASKEFGISRLARNFIKRLNEQTKVVLVVFGSPYSLKYFDKMDNLVCAYEDNNLTRRLAPQVIFGGIGADGVLPITASENLKAGTGFKTESLMRLGYSLPENQHMDSRTLAYIDSIVMEAIQSEATPGCQVLVARNGSVVYEKSFGHYTYENKQRVNNFTIYDLASVTKVAATTQALMFLYDWGGLNLNGYASNYLPELKGTNKERLRVRDILTHQSGLISFIPFWRYTVTEDRSGLSEEYYCDSQDDNLFCNSFDGRFYALTSMEDSLWKWTIESDLMRKRRRQKRYPYRYSDLGLFIMKKVVDSKVNQPMDEFLAQNFYRPLGATHLTYNPLNQFPRTRIVPTENDELFRSHLVWGTVHDQGAAMVGGVAGHAGLFGTANDLAKLMQMNMQDGEYGGMRFFNPGTVSLFSAKQYTDNRRGLGWDKPQLDGRGPTSKYVSPNTFGHTGFTGTCVWADPDYDLVFIFLSNRIYPDTSNRKLISMDVRTRIQSVIYEAMMVYEDRALKRGKPGLDGSDITLSE